MFRDQTKDYILHFVSVAELLKRMINKPAEWVKEMRIPNAKTRNFVYVTNPPDWNIPNAEYSFIEFKEEL